MTGNRKKRTPAGQPWQVVEWQNRTTQSISLCSSREGAVKVSYQVFVRGEGYPEAIVLSGQGSNRVSIRIDDHDDQRTGGEAEGAAGDQAADHPESLSSLWDAWLTLHPEERAAWDVGPRHLRLQRLKEQHVPAVWPFSSEYIIAHPDWYRRLCRVLRMDDELVDTLLHLHRFALAEQEAERLAAEQKDSASRPTRRVAAIYLEQHPVHPERVGDPEETSVPLETQERACRAYCRRVGYHVHGVFRATTPPPDDVPVQEEIGIRPGQAFVYYRSASTHPYHIVNNLLAARTIDVIVEFTARGPSRRLFEHTQPSDSSDSNNLLNMELASLWEIEPPTEDERQVYEVLTRIVQVGLDESEEATEEITQLMEQLHVLAQRVNKAGRRSVISASASPRADVAVRAAQPTICYMCHAQPARDGSAFCSETCAQAAAERFVQTTTHGWCSACGAWIGSDGCPHST